MKPGRRLLIAGVGAMLVGAMAFDAHAQSCSPPGCPQYNDSSPQAFPQNTSIPVIVSNAPSNAGNAVNNAISNVNANAVPNGSGTTFYVSDSVPASGPYVTITFDNTSTVSLCGGVNAVGCTSPYLSSPGVIDHADVAINTAIVDNGVASWDPSNLSDYQSGLAGAVVHELQHTLGVGDSTSNDTVMGAGYAPNRQGNPNQATPCDAAAIRAARNVRATGGSCPA